MKIIPAILTDDPNKAKELILKSETVVDRIQIDIVDGIFANNKTIKPDSLDGVDTKILFDYHLMVDEPVNWIEKVVRGQGDRIIGQIERMNNQSEFIARATENGLLVGLAVNLETPIASLDELVLADLDVVLLMSVKAGFSGQEFSLDVWDKIKELVDMKTKNNYKFKICVDGGVTKELITDMQRAGVDEVVIGTRIFEGGLEENIKLITGGDNA
ncbi:MAG: hypothetical protein AAB656_02555 [Patescibacteria group bacterium]